MDDEEWWPEDVWPKLGKAGFLGVTIPEKDGGPGLDVFSSALILQAFARWNPAVALSWLAHENLCLNNILRNGDPDQRRRYLPGLADGTLVGALALTEPGAGSDAIGSMATTAKRDGDDYLLSGRKLFITNGPIADVILVYAKSAPERGAKGISAFLVEKGDRGFSVAQKLVKMGCRGSQTGELLFDDCRVPARNRIGPENAGVVVLMSGLDLERAVSAAISIGAAERMLDLSLAHARERRQFGTPHRRVPDDPGEARRHVHRHRVDEGPRLQGARRRQRPRARRRRPRRPSTSSPPPRCCTPPKPARASPPTPSRSTAAAATCGRWRSTASTARPS